MGIEEKVTHPTEVVTATIAEFIWGGQTYVIKDRSGVKIGQIAKLALSSDCNIYLEVVAINQIVSGRATVEVKLVTNHGPDKFELLHEAVLLSRLSGHKTSNQAPRNSSQRYGLGFPHWP